MLGCQNYWVIISIRTMKRDAHRDLQFWCAEYQDFLSGYRIAITYYCLRQRAESLLSLCPFCMSIVIPDVYLSSSCGISHGLPVEILLCGDDFVEFFAWDDPEEAVVVIRLYLLDLKFAAVHVGDSLFAFFFAHRPWLSELPHLIVQCPLLLPHLMI